MDLFDTKKIEPMLIQQKEQPAFDSPDYIFELKLDGVRAVAFLDPAAGTELRNKRNKNLNAIYPELSEMHKQVKAKCILDGEIFIMKNGKPVFSEMQKRALMGNSFKIALAEEKLPASFVAFDILYYVDQPVVLRPLMERKECLEECVIEETERFSMSRYVENNGIALFDLTVQQDLEGIVAKRKESKYFQGKRTKDWIKIKNQLEEDFTVCGYIWEKSYIASIVLGRFAGDRMEYIGHVHVGVSSQDFKMIQQAPEVRPEEYYPEFPSEANCRWIKPELICTVRFMEWTKGGGLRQPIFKGIRMD